jgi:hypothetical protein
MEKTVTENIALKRREIFLEQRGMKRLVREARAAICHAEADERADCNSRYKADAGRHGDSHLDGQSLIDRLALKPTGNAGSTPIRHRHTPFHS